MFSFRALTPAPENDPDVDYEYSDENEGSIILSLISQLRYVWSSPSPSLLPPYHCAFLVVMRGGSLFLPPSEGSLADPDRFSACSFGPTHVSAKSVHLAPEWAWISPKSPSPPSSSSLAACSSASPISWRILILSLGTFFPSLSLSPLPLPVFDPCALRYP